VQLLSQLLKEGFMDLRHVCCYLHGMGTMAKNHSHSERTKKNPQAVYRRSDSPKGAVFPKF
jgi:hypothetical protein